MAFESLIFPICKSDHLIKERFFSFRKPKVCPRSAEGIKEFIIFSQENNSLFDINLGEFGSSKV